jgi:hypothetical protein
VQGGRHSHRTKRAGHFHDRPSPPLTEILGEGRYSLLTNCIGLGKHKFSKPAYFGAAIGRIDANRTKAAINCHAPREKYLQKNVYSSKPRRGPRVRNGCRRLARPWLVRREVSQIPQPNAGNASVTGGQPEGTSRERERPERTAHPRTRVGLFPASIRIFDSRLGLVAPVTRHYFLF